MLLKAVLFNQESQVLMIGQLRFEHELLNRSCSIKVSNLLREDVEKLLKLNLRLVFKIRVN
jgi:hypothetical protein